MTFSLLSAPQRMRSSAPRGDRSWTTAASPGPAASRLRSSGRVGRRHSSLTCVLALTYHIIVSFLSTWLITSPNIMSFHGLCNSKAIFCEIYPTITNLNLLSHVPSFFRFYNSLFWESPPPPPHSVDPQLYSPARRLPPETLSAVQLP